MTSAWVAGALVGAIMGLASQAYWLIIFAYRPPAIFTRSGASSSASTVVMLAGLLSLGGWVIIGVIFALIFDAVQSGDPDAPLIPSVGFFMAILFVATAALMPAMVFMRAWLRHIFITYLIFTGLFGLLLPNLVVAVRE